ncbi:ParA family protein [Belnapia rosea]|uniref:Chromosome partitioning protein n=1 Tax=Belnapia rosea TaxID=938405 RepID=A0A1G6Z202_9PROT|nr:ParA family protein [Belnapia rosea]SDD96648.1 chromosome partitioning protein [Belnapia rosea]
MAKAGVLTRSRSAKVAVSESQQPGSSKATKWLLVASGKGGSGKTSTSLNLAVYAVHEGLRVVIVDLDRQASLTRWYERRPPAAPPLILWEGAMGDAKKAVAEIDALEDVDLVIVDTPPGLDDHPDSTRLLVEKANFVLVPTTQGTTDIDSVVEWMGFLRRERVPSAFLLNKAQRTHTRYSKAKARLNRAGLLCPVDVRQLDDIESTHDHGVGVCELRKSRAAEDLGSVWDFVKQQLAFEGVAR